MVQVNFNAANVKPAGGFTVYPSGTYDVMITNSELKDTKAKTEGRAQRGSYIQFSYRIASGEHAGGSIIDRINFENDNPTAEEIGQAQLSALCRVCGVAQLQDTQQLHGIPFKVVLAKEERKDKPGSFNNNVREYLAADGTPAENVQFGAAPAQAAPPQAAPPAATQSPQQATPQQAAPTNAPPAGTPPWQQQPAPEQAAPPAQAQAAPPTTQPPVEQAPAGQAPAGAPPWAQQG